jgi:hypothetical protein
MQWLNSWASSVLFGPEIFQNCLFSLQVLLSSSLRLILGAGSGFSGNGAVPGNLRLLEIDATILNKQLRRFFIANPNNFDFFLIFVK